MWATVLGFMNKVMNSELPVTTQSESFRHFHKNIISVHGNNPKIQMFVRKGKRTKQETK